MSTTQPQTGTPLPRPTKLSQTYWDGCREGELRVQRCSTCGGFEFIPQHGCTKCMTPTLDWVTSSGRGEVYSYTVVHRPQQPQFSTPYVVAIILLDDGDAGWYMLTNLIDVDPEDVNVGMRVEVAFEKMSDVITLPYFRPSA